MRTDFAGRSWAATAFGGVLLGLPVLLAVCILGCHDNTVVSQWRGDRQITIDGQKADWNGIDVYNFKAKKIYLGLVNDAQDLYLLIVSPNRTVIMQALTQGLRVRFHAENENRVLWVGCPHMGRGGRFRPNGGGEPGGRGEPGGSGGDDHGDAWSPGSIDAGSMAFAYAQSERDPYGDEQPGEGDDESPRDEMRGPGDSGESGPNEDLIRRMVHDLPAEIEVFTQTGEDSLRLSSAEAARRGIEEEGDYEDGYFVLEMKVPLVKDGDHPHAIGLPPDALAAGAKDTGKGDVVELNFKIPKREGGWPSGGRRGGGGNRGGGEGGRHLDQSGGGLPGGGSGGGGGGGGGRDGFSGRGSGGARGFRGDIVNGMDVTIKARLSSAPAAP